MKVRFSQRELFDLAVAWIVLSAAFTLILPPVPWAAPVDVTVGQFGLSFLTAGVAFLLHELAHKVAAVRFGKVAEFRANYEMLFVALLMALVGFLFAAPGAVYHRGRSTVRENGLIALAGPVTNLALAAVFAPLALFVDGFANTIGRFGLIFNLFLAAFNMLPYGPLDGKTVWDWNKIAFGGTFVTAAGLTVWAYLAVGLF